jgi:phosphoglycerate dehydrogenase-like enzyme
MSSKPVVALALAESMCRVMFAPEDLERLHRVASVVGPPDNATTEKVAPLLRDAVVAITGWGSPSFDANLLAHAPKLRLVSYSAGSIKGVATDEMYDRGIQITTAAAANAAPVAETTVAMMVVMLKRIPWLIAWNGDRKGRQEVEPIRELRDLSVGIIGASRVGREVIRLLKSYPRLTVRVYDPYLSAADAKEMGVERATLEETCACDVVSIHAPQVPQTKHMINARTLGLMPDHAVLINTSRGSLIDEAALVAEVRKRPMYVYLDVTDPEPPAADSPLRKEKNIVITPHVAGAMNQARRDMGRIAIDETLAFLRGESLYHAVTREMLATQA